MNECRSLQLLAEKYEQVREEGLGGSRTRISDETRNQILSLYQKGIDNDKKDDTNIIKLALRFNVTPRAVNYIITQSGFRRGYGQTQRGSVFQHTAQKIPPAQIKYIDNLISQRDSEGVFEHSLSSIIKIVNDYIDDHPESDWHKTAPDSRANIHNYVKKWEKENVPGETRADYGIKMSNGKIYRNKPVQPDRAGTRQMSFDQLGTNDTSYKTAVGRAQKINDQAYTFKDS